MRFSLAIFAMLIILSACGSPASAPAASHQFTVTNNTPIDRMDELVRLDAEQLASKFGIADWQKAVFTIGDQAVPFEYFAGTGKEAAAKVGLLLSTSAGESKAITLRPLSATEAAPVFPKRTQAEISHKTGGYWEEREYKEGTFKNVDHLSVPPEHTDHSWFIRYEGPGWESDLVGYRFYLDWRNATDIFGKKTRDMVLQQVGQDGFDSYHEPADWGQDVLKVGKSLGVGALGAWLGDHALRVEETDSLDCVILNNGTIESTVRTTYHGWTVADKKTDLTVDLSIHAGSRLTKSEVRLSEPLDNLCTGLGKQENGELLHVQKGKWASLATWGKQSLADDHLGMAVIYRKEDLRTVTEDGFSHVVVLNPKAGELTYYFLAAWEQEPGGIKNRAAFVTYLENTLLKLNEPLTVDF
ncbi:MAG: DUF4861 domain-containing protein [Lewinella sp.]